MFWPGGLEGSRFSARFTPSTSTSAELLPALIPAMTSRLGSYRKGWRSLSAASRKGSCPKKRPREQPVAAFGRPLEPPWEYRARRWEVAAQQAPEGMRDQGQHQPRRRADLPYAVGIAMVRANQ